MFETISKNPIVVPFSWVMLNFGRSNSGKPDGILPATNNHFKDNLAHYPPTTRRGSLDGLQCSCLKHTHRPL